VLKNTSHFFHICQFVYDSFSEYCIGVEYFDIYMSEQYPTKSQGYFWYWDFCFILKISDHQFLRNKDIRKERNAPKNSAMEFKSGVVLCKLLGMKLNPIYRYPFAKMFKTCFKIKPWFWKMKCIAMIKRIYLNRNLKGCLQLDI
jgi:hypothetical protein